MSPKGESLKDTRLLEGPGQEQISIWCSRYLQYSNSRMLAKALKTQDIGAKMGRTINKLVYLLVFFLILAIPAHAQVSLAPVPLQTFFDVNGNPLSGGKVFTYLAGTTTPAATYVDAGGITLNSNPIILNAAGQANIWILNSTAYKFVVQSSSGVTQWTVDNIVSPLTTSILGLANTWTAAQNFTAGITVSGGATINSALTVTGALNSTNGGALSGTYTGQPNFNGGITAMPCDIGQTKYIGGGCTSWAGADILAQFNSAAAALPATGGEIFLLPQTNGACYSANTTANINTAGKDISFGGLAPPNQSAGQVTGGSCILFTHVSANNMFNIDASPGAGGGYVAKVVLHDIALVNSTTEGGSTQCTTNGGCGSSAVAINLGAANSGAMLGNWQNVTIKGFNKGMANEGTSGVGWGGVCVNCSFAYNTNGATFNGTEGFTFIGGDFSVNGTGVKLVAGSVANLKFVGTHFDSNTTLGLDGTAGSCGVVEFSATHFENVGTTNVAYVNCGSGTITFNGGDAQDDTNAGGAAPYWFTGQAVVLNGLTISAAAGRAAPTNLFVVNNYVTGTVNNGSPAVLTGNLGLTAGGTNVAVSVVGPSQTATTTHSRSRFPCITLPGGTTGFADLACDTAVPALKLSNNDAYSQVSRFVDMGRLYNDAGTQQVSPHIVVDGGTLNGASPSVINVTLSGSAVFSNSSSYKCGLTQQGTAANTVKITYSSGSAFVVTGPNGAVDSIGWVCAGD